MNYFVVLFIIIFDIIFEIGQIILSILNIDSDNSKLILNPYKWFIIDAIISIIISFLLIILLIINKKYKKKYLLYSIYFFLIIINIFKLIWIVFGIILYLKNINGYFFFAIIIMWVSIIINMIYIINKVVKIVNEDINRYIIF